MPSNILKGKVLDKLTGNPISRAIIDQNTATTIPHAISKTGEFKFTYDPNGKKSINIQAEGYREQNFRFHTNGKEQVFYLEPLFTEEKPQKNTTPQPPIERNGNEGKEAKELTPKETTADKTFQQKVNQAKQAQKMKENHEKNKPGQINKPKPKQRDWEQIIMIGLLLVLLAAIGYFIYRMYKKSKPHPELSRSASEGNQRAVEGQLIKANPSPAPSAPTPNPSPRIKEM